MEKNNKIAIFITGPPRYVTLVAQRLEVIFKDFDYDCFYHLWTIDRGNKTRQGFQSNYGELLNYPKTKVLVVQKPYLKEDYKDSIGIKTNSGSAINATMGMFMAINLLSHYLKQLPDFNQYKYILRLRTDCAILNDNFASLLNMKSDVITVSKNPTLYSDWISDHICFASKENFLKLWCFKNMNEIFDSYRKGKRDPEKTLAYCYKDFRKQTTLNSSIVRYRDYQIVYSPPKENDPEWAKKLINQQKIEELFLSSDQYIDEKDVARVIGKFEVKGKEPNYFYRLIKRFKFLTKKYLSW